MLLYTRLIKKPTGNELKSWILVEFKNGNVAVILTFSSWWFASWGSFNFDPSAIVGSFLWAFLMPLTVVPLIGMIDYLPANALVNLGRLDYIDSYGAIAWFYPYCGLYWGIFVFLHYKIFRNRRVIYFLLLTIFLLFTWHGCSARLDWR
jgi:hypothetical protein